MDKVYRLTGSVTTQDGTRVRDLNLAVVAANSLEEIHLGAGKTDVYGEFRLSLTAREIRFRLPVFRKSRAELQLIFSVERDGKRYVVHRHDCGVHLEENPNVDLGEIRIADWDLSALDEERIDAKPRILEGTNRLRVDRELVLYCLQEVAPKVEHLTGWSGLLEDVEVDVTNNYRKGFSHLLKEPGFKTGLLENCLLRLWFRLIVALYEPFSKTIIINRRAAGRNNLDGLKVVLGHELVHVGQFKNCPKLMQRYRDSIPWLLDQIQNTSLSFAELVETIDYSLHQYFMSEVEGYAVYIQRYLEQYYTCAEIVQQPSLGVRIALRLACLVSADMQKVIQMKSEQYQGGLEGFSQLADGNEPARFTM